MKFYTVYKNRQNVNKKQTKKKQTKQPKQQHFFSSTSHKNNSSGLGKNTHITTARQATPAILRFNDYSNEHNAANESTLKVSVRKTV